MGKTKKKEITQKDLAEAVEAETAELIREEREKILHRAKQRLAAKFGK